VSELCEVLNLKKSKLIEVIKNDDGFSVEIGGNKQDKMIATVLVLNSLYEHFEETLNEKEAEKEIKKIFKMLKEMRNKQ
jgi:hypothetical protein